MTEDHVQRPPPKANSHTLRPWLSAAGKNADTGPLTASGHLALGHCVIVHLHFIVSDHRCFLGRPPSLILPRTEQYISLLLSPTTPLPQRAALRHHHDSHVPHAYTRFRATMNNLDRGKIRMAQIKWFMGGKAHGEPFPHSPPDSLHLWGPKLPRQHHHDVTLEEGHPHYKATTTATAEAAPGAAGPSREAGA